MAMVMPITFHNDNFNCNSYVNGNRNSNSIDNDKDNCQRAAEAKRPRLRGGSIIEPRVYLDVQGEKISSDPEKR